MRNYLSFGGGVNSVALHLLLLDEGVDFESVFVHHGTDWPETYQYVAGFQWWLKQNGHKPITVLRPNVGGESNLYEYFWKFQMVPQRFPRICTVNFKIKVLNKYYKAPCFVMIGIDSGEPHRAKISTDGGIEKRYPLVEYEIDRAGCVDIIKAHGLPGPMKSGCYICPFQKISQWKALRNLHPDLFCKAVKLEEQNMKYRISKGKKAGTLSPRKVSLSALVDEKQGVLFEQDEYPPCLCGL